MASLISRRSLSLSLASCGLFAKSERQVAITIDDIPRGGDKANGRDFASVSTMTRQIVEGLAGAPAIAFANPGRAREMSVEEFQKILAIWSKGGVELGNHTNTHPDFHRTAPADYFADIQAAETSLQPARGGRRSLYFRHPYLRTGVTKESREALRRFLNEQKYIVAPINVDTADYMFALVYQREGKAVLEQYVSYLETVFAFFEKRSTEVLGREIAQTLLIHANQLNADAMPQMLSMLRRRGYKIVSLTEALKDPLYQTKEDYMESGGISWIHRWGKAKNMPIVWEPEPPAAINESYRRYTQARP